jgi:hypothetical protein
MKQEPTSTNGLTRRSFVKRSVVAAAAASSMTIFSGLVDAAKPEGCYRTEFINHKGKWKVAEDFYKCGEIVECFQEDGTSMGYYQGNVGSRCGMDNWCNGEPYATNGTCW